MSAAARGFEGQPLELRFGGVAGECVSLFAARQPAFLPLPANQGVYAVGLPLVLGGVVLGPLPAGGILTVPLVVPELGLGIDAADLSLQPAFLTSAGAVLGPSRVVTFIDPAA